MLIPQHQHLTPIQLPLPQEAEAFLQPPLETRPFDRLSSTSPATSVAKLSVSSSPASLFHQKPLSLPALQPLPPKPELFPPPRRPIHLSHQAFSQPLPLLPLLLPLVAEPAPLAL